jgi:hypothetical protein
MFWAGETGFRPIALSLSRAWRAAPLSRCHYADMWVTIVSHSPRTPLDLCRCPMGPPRLVRSRV